jgi:hypothetical protein
MGSPSLTILERDLIALFWHNLAETASIGTHAAILMGRWLLLSGHRCLPVAFLILALKPLF